MSTPGIQVITYLDSAAANLCCAFCKRPFQDREHRQHVIHISPANKVTQEIFHAQDCYEMNKKKDELNALNRISIVRGCSVVDKTNVKAFEAVISSQYAYALPLSRAYPDAIVTLFDVRTPTSYTAGTVKPPSFVLDFPISINAPLNPISFDFQQFKSFFTICVAYTIIPTGDNSSAFWTKLADKMLLVAKEKKIGMWAWIHQVTGTNNEYRLIIRYQPEETVLVHMYNSKVVTRWTEFSENQGSQGTKFNTDWNNLTRELGDANFIVQSLFNTAANEAKLQCVKASIASHWMMSESDSVHTRTGVIHRVSYNCFTGSRGQCRTEEKEDGTGIYILPAETCPQLNMLYCLKDSSESPVPCSYSSLVDLQCNLSKLGAQVQSLTNYRVLMSYCSASLIQIK